MMSSLKKQAVHGAFWSFIERFGQLGVQFIIAVILARLLDPKDFGVLAMIMVFFSVAQSIVNSGFGQALIQKQDADHTDESTVFWFNIFAGCVMALLLCVGAPWIAAFYDQPLLIPVTRVFSLNLIILSFGIVHNALLTKELAFKKRMHASIASLFVSGVVGVFMAWRGFGVWALVAQQLSSSLVRTAGLWIVYPWRPSFLFSIKSFRVLWRFGSNMLFSGLFYTLFLNIHMLVIGKLFSVVELGLYERSKKLTQVTSQSFAQVVSQVNFPLLSRIQNDPERMRRVFSKVLQSTMLATVPMMVGFAVAAPGIIYILYGEKWMACVPYLQIMCIYGSFFPVHALNLNVILAFGRSDLHFRLEVIKRVLTIISIAIMYRYGVIGLLWGQVACSTISLALNTYYVKRYLNYGLLAQIGLLRKIFIASAIMGVASWVVGRVDFGSMYTRFGAQVVVGIAVFVVAALMLRDSVFMEALTAGIGKLKKWKIGQSSGS